MLTHQSRNIPRPRAHFQSQTSADAEPRPPGGKPKLNGRLKQHRSYINSLIGFLTLVLNYVDFLINGPLALAVNVKC